MAAQRNNHGQKINDFLRQGYAYNNYPFITHSHMSRHNLDIVEDGQGKAQGTLRNEEICMVCKGEASEGKELFTCDGQFNGEMKKQPFQPCNSKFHLDCIKAYNASGYDFAYAARPECQRKFLCPLHCCSVCNTENMKQSAYESELIECAFCFRAFHSKCCYPAGSKQLDVIIESATYKMLVCPSHSEPAPVLQHLPACCSEDCKVKGELQECKKCIRSYHPGCRKVKKIKEELTEKDAPEDLCDSCLCEDVLIVNMRVASEQFMALSDGFTMDMDRYGSIARYVNHSCKNFNAEFPKKHAYVGKCKRLYLFEQRRYLKASRVIEAGEEVTVSYGFTNKSCFCDSCLEEKKELEKLEWIENLDKENDVPSGATKRKAAFESNSPKAKVFKPSN
ncbi:hypothetical protein CAEBREN_21793 [Caenorhabditis brenneri]|uniref:SET domain-containing protein n=1 Tax=Caenorhabditis brenneri TaxID=135651 RepID=G0NFW6_CAEBE|nr:hypothetical protein CAEBREN_21793 [Caenorhabditis brenneri]